MNLTKCNKGEYWSSSFNKYQLYTDFWHNKWGMMYNYTNGEDQCKGLKIKMLYPF